MELISESLRQRIQTQDKTQVPALPYALAQQALSLIHDTRVNDELSIFRFICSANYLNAFVKQSQNSQYHHDYRFKEALTQFLLNNVGNPFLKVFEEKGVLMVECADLIFSFHGMDCKKLEPVFDSNPPTWLNIRLQPYAIELLTEALKNHS